MKTGEHTCWTAMLDATVAATVLDSQDNFSKQAPLLTGEQDKRPRAGRRLMTLKRQTDITGTVTLTSGGKKKFWRKMEGGLI